MPCSLGPAEQSPVVAYHKRRLGCSAQELGASGVTCSDSSALSLALVIKESQAEFDCRNAKGGKGKGGKKGSQGEE